MIRPSSSSSPQSPQVEPGGRCFHRFVTVLHSSSSGAVALYRPVGLVCDAGASRSSAQICLQNRRTEGTAHAGQALCRLRRRTHPRADRPVHDPPAQAPARPRGLGGGLRDRAARRGRGRHLPAAAHAWVRGLDDLALPPDRWAHARGRPRDDHRGPRPRRGRRRGHAPQPVALRPLLRRPRAVHGARPRLQRLHHRAVHALLLAPRPDGAGAHHRRRRGRGRDRAGRCRRLPGHPAAGGAAEALLLTRLRPRVGGGAGQRRARLHPHPDGRGEGQRPGVDHAQGRHGERRAGQPAR